VHTRDDIIYVGKHLNRHVQKQLAVLPASTLAQVSPTNSCDIAVTLTVISKHFESMMVSDKRQALFHECFHRVTFGVLLLIKASTCCIEVFFFFALCLQPEQYFDDCTRRQTFSGIFVHF
jgi:hypothetical protein